MLELPECLQGSYVFPIVAGTKVPAIEGGWKSASNDPAQIAEWERALPGCNWAVATGLSGLFVIDVDPEGLETWERMQNEDEDLRKAIRTAYTVCTPRGGYHIYYRGYGPSTASRIAPGIDTRGGVPQDDGSIQSGGYVLTPGSRTGVGVYIAVEGGRLDNIPDSITQLIPERKHSETHGLERNPDLDQPRNLQWATDLLKGYVQSGRVSVQGRGGDNLAFQVAASILDKAISPGACYDLLWEHWNPYCQPPWDDWELERVVRNASAYGEDTGKGAKGFQANADVFANFVSDVVEPSTEKRKRFQPMWLKEARMDRRPARWLIPGLLPAEGTGILYGLTGSYKTFVALDWSLCLAHGISGQWGAPPVKHQVLFLAGESSYALRQERVDAWCAKHELDPDNSDFIFVHGVPAYSDTEGWTEIRDGLAEMGAQPALIVIDTLTREMTGLDENSNNDGKAVLKFNEELAQHYGCMVLAIGHTGKEQAKGLRGAQVFMDNSDAVLFLRKQSGGVALIPKKLKEVDCDDTPIYLEVQEYEKSIVLGKVETLAEEPKAGSSRVSWASGEEVAAVLHANGGEMSTGMLSQTIAADKGIEVNIVRRKLLDSAELKWLRVDSNTWVIPKREWDL